MLNSIAMMLKRRKKLYGVINYRKCLQENRTVEISGVEAYFELKTFSSKFF